MYNAVSSYLSTSVAYGSSAWEAVKAATPVPVSTVVNAVTHKYVMVPAGAIFAFGVILDVFTTQDWVHNKKGNRIKDENGEFKTKIVRRPLNRILPYLKNDWKALTEVSLISAACFALAFRK
jgi:hypothetical protein